ncbi:MAG: DICT sensory domain-containing protein [Solirubrobacteraceae bacterium]
MSIGDVVRRTGVAEATLRMWERRHGFPAPQRLPSGHRRYSERDVELVRRVASDRAAGLSLAAAIARATVEPAASPSSIYAILRRSRPDLQVLTLTQSILLALTRAIEDESLSRAEHGLLFATFQKDRFYRQSEARWRELARTAELTIAFADFPAIRMPADGPIEMPLDAHDAVAREWTVVCCAPGHAVCLAAWELPATDHSQARVFEAIWSVEPDVVWQAARVCAELAAAQRPALIEPLRTRLYSDPGPPTTHQLALAAAITSRALSRLSAEVLARP